MYHISDLKAQPNEAGFLQGALLHTWAKQDRPTFASADKFNPVLHSHLSGVPDKQLVVCMMSGVLCLYDVRCTAGKYAQSGLGGQMEKLGWVGGKTGLPQ